MSRKSNGIYEVFRLVGGLLIQMLDLEFEGRGGTALKCFGCVSVDCGI